MGLLLKRIEEISGYPPFISTQLCKALNCCVYNVHIVILFTPSCRKEIPPPLLPPFPPPVSIPRRIFGLARSCPRRCSQLPARFFCHNHLHKVGKLFGATKNCQQRQQQNDFFPVFSFHSVKHSSAKIETKKEEPLVLRDSLCCEAMDLHSAHKITCSKKKTETTLVFIWFYRVIRPKFRPVWRRRSNVRGNSPSPPPHPQTTHALCLSACNSVSPVTVQMLSLSVYSTHSYLPPSLTTAQLSKRN